MEERKKVSPKRRQRRERVKKGTQNDHVLRKWSGGHSYSLLKEKKRERLKERKRVRHKEGKRNEAWEKGTKKRSCVTEMVLRQ